MNHFQDYRNSKTISSKSPHIIVGEHSYYSGFYHGHEFDHCVLYLDEKDDKTNQIDKLIIGKYCSIASGAKFMLGGTQGHNYEWISAYPLDKFDGSEFLAQKWKGDTVIGNDVWIGFEALIMPGIHIADGAVIGARSVVTKNVGPYEIWGGNPAKLIKKRFSDEQIQKLLDLKWWNFDEQTIKENLPFLRSNDIDGLWNKFHGP